MDILDEGGFWKLLPDGHPRGREYLRIATRYVSRDVSNSILQSFAWGRLLSLGNKDFA